MMPENPVKPEKSTPKCRILLVEDENIIAMDLQLRLSELGYDVVAIASDGETAIARASNLRPDLVLMDIHLNGDIDGIEVAKQFVRLHIPVIFLTAYATDETLARAMDSQPYGYLIKPVSTQELHATIQTAINRNKEILSLSTNEKKLQLALNSAEIGTWEWQPETGKFTSAGLFDAILDSRPNPINSGIDDFIDHIVDEDKLMARHRLEHALSNNERLDSYFRYYRKDGGIGWIEVHARPTESAAGIFFTGVVKDVTERRRMEEELRKSAAVFETISEGLYMISADGLIISVNPAFETLTGYSSHELIGRNPNDFLYEENSRYDFAQILDTRKNNRWESEIVLLRGDGKKISVWQSLTAVTGDSGTVSHFVAAVTDIARLRKADEQINHLAYHDALTDLPNRTLMFDRLQQCIKQAQRKNTHIAIMFIDLDGFKSINDTLGHAAGDYLLKQVSERTRKKLRGCDTLARIGGDEFVLIADDLEHSAYAQKIADIILDTINMPLCLDGHEIRVTGSIGIAVYPENGKTPEQLLHAADSAMYKAKRNGKNRICFFSPDTEPSWNTATTDAIMLRQSIDSGALRLFYQPQYRIDDGTMIGVEALVRWLHPDEGLITPDRFLQIANTTGLIESLGKWVTIEACKQLSAWIRSTGQRLKLSINVSVSQVINGDIIRQLPEILQETGFPAELLELEITEDGLQKLDHNRHISQALRDLGISIALDDYGTGLTSLSAINNSGINRIKIDTSIIHNILDRQSDTNLIDAITAMAHKLGLKLVAEGVEHVEQLIYLSKIGCDEAQGYYLGRPMPWDDLLHTHLAA